MIVPKMENFALIGSAGYIAEKHMKAVKETGNRITVATDIFDVMGRMDSYFPEAEFFTGFDDFEHFVNRQQKTKEQINYFSICTPNYLHTTHILSALNHGAVAICEKPLVIYPTDIEKLEQAEQLTGNKIFNVLQLRLHPVIIALRERIKNNDAGKMHDVDLTYITSRGKWYYKSWKGDVAKSGGVVNNIGVHFFDMLSWIFGSVQKITVHRYENDKAAGFLELKNAKVRWYLSLDYNDIPDEAGKRGLRTYRSISVDGVEIEFSDGFTDLHTQTYRNILEGNGFGLEDVKPCIHLTNAIRHSPPVGLKGDYHPMLIMNS